ncbi:MAG: glycoside hydrolase family 16 protein [Oscillospiraceae bacterium]|jgi:beta-glucanase (GH16 family)|nr:glycoside hydrolase family 16 protein [Oscillospiraceae bacterium]
MFESLLGKKLAWRQMEALREAKRALRGLTNGKRLTAVLLLLVQAIGCVLFDTPLSPSGEVLDLSGYELVFEDEFDGDSLDMTKWVHRGQGAAAGGYFADSQVFLENGNMVMRGEYLENGKFGPGWYAGMVKTYEDYQYGYFEMRCIPNPDNQFWSAFWLQSNHSYTPEISKGGVGGAEIDIFESMNYNRNFLHMNAVHQTIHCSGMEDDPTNGTGLNSQSVGVFYGKSIFQEYNTYGLEWNEEEYIFYINGVETRRTSFADGTSKVPEQVIASICLSDEITHEKYFKTDFLVDYVRIYQKSA